jgi:hypothetical protein
VIRLLAVTLMVGLLVTMGVAAVRVGAEPRATSLEGERNREHLSSAKAAAFPDTKIVSLYRNHSAAYYAWRLRQRTRQLQAARATAREIIHAPVYGKSTLENAFLCIHRYEGSWWDSGSPFWGGLQMDRDFQQTYASWAVAAFGTADHWPISVQIATAIRAYVSGRGFYPWPNTARYCGLI